MQKLFLKIIKPQAFIGCFILLILTGISLVSADEEHGESTRPDSYGPIGVMGSR